MQLYVFYMTIFCVLLICRDEIIKMNISESMIYLLSCLFVIVSFNIAYYTGFISLMIVGYLHVALNSAVSEGFDMKYGNNTCCYCDKCSVMTKNKGMKYVDRNSKGNGKVNVKGKINKKKENSKEKNVKPVELSDYDQDNATKNAELLAIGGSKVKQTSTF